MEGLYMKLSNEAYDIASFIGKILLPAAAVFYRTLAAIWPQLPYQEQIPETIMAFDLLWNTCLGFSSAAYYKDLVLNSEGEEVIIDVENVEHQEGAVDGDSDRG